MAVFTWVPDYGLSEDFEPKVLEAKFGDGYSQRSALGINNIGEGLSPSFTQRPKAEVDAMHTFLRAHGGILSFDYTVPGAAMKRYICKKWSRSHNHDLDASLSADFTRVFEL